MINISVRITPVRKIPGSSVIDLTVSGIYNMKKPPANRGAKVGDVSKGMFVWTVRAVAEFLDQCGNVSFLRVL